MDNLLTVIIQTSPLPSHPSTALLDALFRSFDKVKHLKECNFVILCDGCEGGSENLAVENIDTLLSESKSKPNYKHGTCSQLTADKYRLHLQILQDKIQKQEEPFVSHNNGSIKLLKLPHRYGSARAIEAAFEMLSIDTPYILIG